MVAHIIKMGNDIDTDQILPSQYMLSTIEDMKQYTFETLYPDFCEIVQTSRIIVAGENFGCGSSREQAPQVLKALGIQVIIAKSFARIFFRNALNIGLPVVICETLHDKVKNTQPIDVDLKAGTVKTKEGEFFICTAMPSHLTEILLAGGLIEYLNERMVEAWE